MSDTTHVCELIKLRDRLYAMEDEIMRISRTLDIVINNAMARTRDGEHDSDVGVAVTLSEAEHDALEYLLDQSAIGSAEDALVLKNLIKRIVK